MLTFRGTLKAKDRILLEVRSDRELGKIVESDRKRMAVGEGGKAE